MLKLAVIVGVVGVIIYHCFLPDVPISGASSGIILGQQGYDITVLSAPVAKSAMLDFVSYLLTRTRFAPFIRRIILNDNKISNLRELAAQIELPPMAYPMCRVTAERYDELTSEKDVIDAEHVVRIGFPEDTILGAIHRREQNGTHDHREPYPRMIMEYHNFYRSGAILPSNVISSALSAVQEWETKGFRIFSSILAEEVMQSAYESDERWRRGEQLSVFDGVPVAFKDMMDVKGHTIYEGKNPHPSHAEEWVLADNDDLMVERLRALGAIIFGVTIEVEGGVSPLGFNAHFQGPVNPYSWNRYSGGSSSGSAVAVATGIVPVAIGYDGGGSIRIPACLSGVHGLATTFGRIPFANHTETTMIKGGPLSASSLDAALTHAVISRNAPMNGKVGSFYSILYDGGVRGPPMPHLRGFTDVGDLSDVRIGIFPEWFEDSDPIVRERCKQAIKYLTSRGAKVVHIRIPHLQIMSIAHAMRIATEFALGFDEHYYKYPTSMEPGGRVVVAIGSTVTALESLSADKIRAWAFEYVTSLFAKENLTAIVNPTVGIEVPVLEEDAKLRGESNNVLAVKMMKYIFIANLLGLPGYSVPVGFIPASHSSSSHHDPTHPEDATSLQLPVGLHLLGNHWEEHKLLRLAHSIETGFTNKLTQRKPRPMFFHDPFVNIE